MTRERAIQDLQHARSLTDSANTHRQLAADLVAYASKWGPRYGFRMPEVVAFVRSAGAYMVSAESFDQSALCAINSALCGAEKGSE